MKVFQEFCPRKCRGAFIVFALLCTIYAADKRLSGSVGSAREEGGATAVEPREAAPAPQSEGCAFTGFAVADGGFAFSLSWPSEASGDFTAIDFFHKGSLADPNWRWIDRVAVDDPAVATAAVFIAAGRLPFLEVAANGAPGFVTNLVAAPFGAIYTNLVAYTDAPAPSSSGFFLAAGQRDSDGDGLSDAVETSLGLDASDPDADADALPDGAEFLLGTNPKSPDSDGDGRSDSEEVFAGSDPLAASPPPGPTIRYFHDDDGCLVASFPGVSPAASATTWSPAGNAVSIGENAPD